MQGGTNAQPTLSEKHLATVTTDDGSRTEVGANSIILARFYGITASGMIYIRIDNANNIEQRQYGSYATASQQIMITGYANKGEKVRVTGATGSTALIYGVSLGGGIKALLGKARALLQEVLSHAGKHQCDKQGTAIHRLTYFERKMDTQRGRRAGNDRWIIGHRQWGSIDHGMHRAPHEITGWECKLPNIRPIRLGHMPRLCYGGRDPEIQLAGHNDRIWDGNVQYRMTKGMVA